MSSSKHAQKNYGKLFIMIIAAVALVGIIVATAVAIGSHRSTGKLSAQTVINSIAMQSEIPLEKTAEQEGVTYAAKCLDDSGKFLCYAVIGFAEGFCDRVAVTGYFSEDGKTLIGIAVSDHSETVGHGADVADSPFTQRFEYAEMPVYLYDGTIAEEDIPKDAGTRVDALSGATVSSYAVANAVNAAHTYLVNHIL